MMNLVFRGVMNAGKITGLRRLNNGYFHQYHWFRTYGNKYHSYVIWYRRCNSRYFLGGCVNSMQ